MYVGALGPLELQVVVSLEAKLGPLLRALSAEPSRMIFN